MAVGWRLRSRESRGLGLDLVASLLVARTLLVAPGTTASNKKLLGTKGIATRRKKLQVRSKNIEELNMLSRNQQKT